MNHVAIQRYDQYYKIIVVVVNDVYDIVIELRN